MILSIPGSSGNIGHFDNIQSIHRSQSEILNSVEEFNPLYAGGYPMALLFAPRLTGNTKIKPGYYHDYDLYFPDESKLQAATERLNEKLGPFNGTVYETENALTYKFEISPTVETHIQVVKIRSGTPQEILSTFDFKNCAVGYSPATKTVHFHYQSPKLHIDKKLDILEPWMIDDIPDAVEANVIVQLMRFKKYCLRWNYSLTENSFNKLYALYKERPDIKIQANQTYLVHDGPYDRQTFIGLQNQNVWSAIAPIMRDNTYWSDELDVHNLIKNSNELTYEDTIAATAPTPTVAAIVEEPEEHIPF